MFQNHTHSSTLTRVLSESSVIFVKSAPYIALRNITVTSNKCTAILALRSTLVFSGYSLISDNHAMAGAGIRLCSSALIYLTPHTQLVIKNNTAQQRGGGILVNSNCLVNIPLCFYQFSRSISQNHALVDTISFSVYDNSAGVGGDSIYGGSIDYCYLLYIHRNNRKFMNLIQVPNNTIDKPSSISSNPQQVCFYEPRDHMRCLKEMNFSKYPGQDFSVNVRVIGQVHGAVSGTVLASIRNDEASIHPNQQVQSVNISGEELVYTIYSTKHELQSGNEIHMNLEVDEVSDSNIHEYITGYLPTVVKITFLNCPFGFKLSNIGKNILSCVCSEDPSIEQCCIDDQTIQKKAGAWVGTFSINNSTYLASSARCPLDFCDCDVRQIDSTASSLDQDHQCRYNRTGTLCGACPEGWSLILGSLECRENCSHVWLLLIVPFALLGLLLVLAIYFLNLTVTMGTINGLILYANVIQDYSVELFQNATVPGLTRVLTMFIAWFNLDLGIPTCFYDGMSAFGKNLFLGAFPVYIWLISVIIILLSRRYIFVTRIVGNNAVKVLATLFLLSYSQMLRVTIGTLNASVVHVHMDSNTIISKTRWILDGNVPYFDASRHLAQLVVGIFFIVISLPFTFALLCIKHVYSLSTCCRAFAWIDRLKPFFDTYTGPFKDRARFWTGLLLLTRLALLLIHTADYNNSNTTYYYIILACFVLCSLMNGVYKNHYLNVLECFFICNLGIVFLSLVGVSGGWKRVTSHILVGSSFLAFIGIIAYHVYLKSPLRSYTKATSILAKES